MCRALGSLPSPLGSALCVGRQEGRLRGQHYGPACGAEHSQAAAQAGPGSGLALGVVAALMNSTSSRQGLAEYCTLIDSSSSFRAYRAALSEVEPPCIPYL